MDEELSVETEIRRLRKVAERILLFEPAGATARDRKELALIKDSARFALSRMKAARGQYIRSNDELRKLARASCARITETRDAPVLAEIDAIQAEMGELAYYRLAEELDKRGKVEPPQAMNWNPCTVRNILRRREKRATA